MLYVYIGLAVLFAYMAALDAKLNRISADLKKQQQFIHEKFYNLQQYLYEIDPQFEDERQSNRDMEEEKSMAEFHGSKLIEEKESQGQRTLNTNF